MRIKINIVICLAIWVMAPKFCCALQNAIEFKQRMSNWKERMEAREKAVHEIENRELTKARKESILVGAKVKSQVDEASGLLKKTFERNRQERTKTLYEISSELAELRKEIGFGGRESIYDQWISRQERKADKIKESLRRERAMRKTASGVARQDMDEQRRTEQKELKKRFIEEKAREHKRAVEEGRFYYLHSSPNWPWNARSSDSDGFCFLMVGFQWHPIAFSENGGRQELAELEYAPGVITLKDLAVESRLFAAGASGVIKDKFVEQTLPLPPRPAPDRKFNPLYILRDVPVTLSSTRDQVPMSAGFSINMGDRRNVLSIVASAVYLSRFLEVKMAKQPGIVVPTDANVYPALALAIQKYIDAPIHLLKETFDKRKVDLGGRDRYLDLCSVKLALHRTFEFKRHEGKGIVGASLSFPVYSRDGPDSFLTPRIESVRFPSVAVYSAISCKYSRLLTPHGFIQFSGLAPTVFSRRVPHKKSYNPVTGERLPLLMSTFVQDTTPIKTAFDDYTDSEVAMFAEEVKSVKIFRPLEFDLIIGNELAEIFDYSGFLDLSYQLRIKVEDSIRIDEETGREWMTDKLLFKPVEIEHQIAINWRYQGSDKATFNIGGSFTLLGKNCPGKIEVHLAANLDF